MNQTLKSRNEIKKVIINATIISKMFFIIESLDIAPNIIPRKTIQISIVRKDIKKVGIPAFWIKKKGIEGTMPPIRGAVPFVSETIKLANLSAFS